MLSRYSPSNRGIYLYHKWMALQIPITSYNECCVCVVSDTLWLLQEQKDIVKKKQQTMNLLNDNVSVINI